MGLLVGDTVGGNVGLVVSGGEGVSDGETECSLVGLVLHEGVLEIDGVRLCCVRLGVHGVGVTR